MTNVAVQLAVVRDLVEALNAHDYDRAYALFSPSAEHLGQPERAKGRDAMREIDSVFYDAFPDHQHDLEQVVADGTNVVAIMRVTGTHTGDVAGPPTGRRVSFLMCNVVGFDGEGRIASMRQFFDSAEVTRQLSGGGGGGGGSAPEGAAKKRRRRRTRRPKQATAEGAGAPGEHAAEAPSGPDAGNGGSPPPSGPSGSGNGGAAVPPPSEGAAPPPPPPSESAAPPPPPAPSEGAAPPPPPPPAEGTPPGAPPAAPAPPAEAG